MEFFGLDKDKNIVGNLDPYNVQWNRKYYEAGSFEIELDPKQYDPNMEFIFTKDRPELGMIEKVEWSADNVTKVKLLGRFVEQMLNDKIIYPTYYGRGEVSIVLITMLNQYKEDIPIVVNYDNMPSLGIIDFQETGGFLGLRMAEILKTFEYGYRTPYDFVNNRISFEFYQGKDCTQGNTQGNNFVTFATTWQNLQNPTASTDKSDYKNYAVVAGSGEADERIYTTVDLSNGGYKKKIFVDSRNSQYNPEEQTLDQYKEDLRQEGLEALLDYQEIKNVDFFPVASSYEYMVDYDLGYKCEAIIEDIGLAVEGRIVAIYEVFKQGQHTIELELGNQVVTKIKKLEKRLIL